MNIPFLIVMVFCTAVHLTATIVVAVFASRRIQFLPLTLILAILTTGLAFCALLFYSYETAIDVGLFFPGIVFPLAVSAFLEALYPIGIILPGYLQIGRMIKYSLPLVILVFIYSITLAILGKSAPVYHSLGEMFAGFWQVMDTIARFLALAFSFTFVLSIVLLPRQLLKAETPIPPYVTACCASLGITYACFFVLSIHFFWWLLYLTTALLTAVNIAFVLHSLESIAESIPRPGKRGTEPAAQPAKSPANPRRDFNEDNLFRFSKIEQYMQSSTEWRDTSYTREKLCEAVGCNRHILLQSLRSQGYNTIHEYIMTYRVEYLSRLLQSNPEGNLSQLCFDAGFSTLITARSAYKKVLGRELNEDFPKK